jgi:DNA ligase-4
MDWDPKRPPTEIVELAGGDKQHEKPDVWIYPKDSVVLSVKAASIHTTEQFKSGLTLRFPRFKKLRDDKDWKSALSVVEFRQLKSQIDEEQQEKQFKIDDERRKRSIRKRKREVVIQGQDEVLSTPYAGPATKVFEGLNFFIMTDALKPIKKSKAELEQLVKANGGNVVASDKDSSTIVIADRNLVKVASIQKRNERNLIRPAWLLDCVKQSEIDVGRPTFLLPLEPEHLFYTMSSDTGKFDDNVDEHGDSYARDVTPEELLALFKRMPSTLEDEFVSADLLEQLNEHCRDLDFMPGLMFHGVKVFCAGVSAEVMRILAFEGGEISDSLDDEQLSHVVVSEGSQGVKELRKTISSRKVIPRIVSTAWVLDSWKEKTKLDEERKLSLPHVECFADSCQGYQL